MPTVTFYPAVDGGLRRYTGSETWQQAHDATSATDVYDAAANTACVASYPSLGLMTRGFFSFDTSSLPDTAVVTSATLTITGAAALTGSAGSVELVASTQASNTALVANDYDNVGTTAYATGIALTSWNASGTNVFTLNSTGRSAINLTGHTLLALRHSSDINNSSPGSDNVVPAYFSEQGGTGSDPVLSITYLGGASSDTWAWSDTTLPPAAAARTGGTQRTIFSSGGTLHYQFPTMVKMASGRQLVLARKSTTGHATHDGVAVSSYSDDDGATWSSAVVETTLQAGQDDYRGGNMQVFASGRVGHVFFTADDSPVKNRGWYSYSDNDGGTWSTPVQIDTAAVDEGAFVASDLVELPSGRLVVIGFGRATYASSEWFGLTVYSDDGGATWSDLGTLAAYATYGYNVVEPQIERFETGELFATFHTEDGLPTNFYRTHSTDGGATWAAATLVTATSYNRQGIVATSDKRGVVIAYSGDLYSFRYIESSDYGSTFASSVEIAADPGSGERYITWAMPTILGGTGLQQNVGFVYSWENGSQTTGSVYFKQFSGLDGTFIYPRGSSDAWAWSDVASQTFMRNRTTADSWAWSDAAVTGAATADSWAWSDSVARVYTQTRTTPYPFAGIHETWNWSEAATGGVAQGRAASDGWAWSDVASRGGAVPSKTTSDVWTWSESASGSLGPVVDTWSWADFAAVTTSISGVAGQTGTSITSLLGAEVVMDGVVDASLTFTAVV